MATHSRKKSAKKTGSGHSWRVVVTEGPKVSRGSRPHVLSKMLRGLTSDSRARVTSTSSATTPLGSSCPRNKKHAEIDLRIERKNAELRSKYLQTAKLYTDEDVRKLIAKKRQNASDPSSRWKRERRVFAIQDGEKDRFPGFPVC